LTDFFIKAVVERHVMSIAMEYLFDNLLGKKDLYVPSSPNSSFSLKGLPHLHLKLTTIHFRKLAAGWYLNLWLNTDDSDVDGNSLVHSEDR